MEKTELWEKGKKGRNEELREARRKIEKRGKIGERQEKEREELSWERVREREERVMVGRERDKLGRPGYATYLRVLKHAVDTAVTLLRWTTYLTSLTPSRHKHKHVLYFPYLPIEFSYILWNNDVAKRKLKNLLSSSFLSESFPSDCGFGAPVPPPEKWIRAEVGSARKMLPLRVALAVASRGDSRLSGNIFEGRNTRE